MKHISTRLVRLLSLVLVPAMIIVAIGGGGGGVATAAHQPMPAYGLVCTTNPSATFTLTTREGAISTPDGNMIYMWGFSEGDSPFQHPGPVLCVTEGDEITIVLHNTLAHDVSIIFPGQENVMANGLPSQPQFDGGGNLTSLAPVAAAHGGTMTYSFVANRPGTYIYESGTEMPIQVNMGLFGALVVRPASNPYAAYNEVATGPAGPLTSEFTPGEEFLMLMSEIDPILHMAVEQGQPFNMNNYRPRYWLINGRGFPDTLAPNGADWLPEQPFGAMLYVHPFNDDPGAGEAYHPHPALVRYLSVGTMNFPHHPHGDHNRVIAHDGNALVGPGGEDLSYEEFTTLVGPGQTYDVLWDWEDVENWHPVDNPIPVVIPQLQNLVFGQFYSGSPYLGATDLLPVGHQALNSCGEYYHISHNHALQQITAWGVVLSGHITFARIDPPLPNNCQ